MRHIGIFANPTNPSALSAVQSIIDAAMAVSFSCALDASIRRCLPEYSAFPSFEEAPPEAIIALGGDGTILRAATIAVPLDVPVLGVNFGRVGFMSAVNSQKAPLALRRLAEGDYLVDARMLLSCAVNGGETHDCINDAILYKKRFSGVADIHVSINGVDAGSVFCDGLIVSTPNGATGYSISAGGPVVAQGLDVAIVTPICPHTLCFRPIVAQADADIRLSMHSDGYLAIDGILTRDISEKDVITLTRSQNSAKFIQFGQQNIYELIRTKLS